MSASTSLGDEILQWSTVIHGPIWIYKHPWSNCITFTKLQFVGQIDVDLKVVTRIRFAKSRSFYPWYFRITQKKKKHASRTTRARCRAAALGRPSFKHLGGLDPWGATGCDGIFKGKNGGTWATSLWIPRSRSRLTAPSMLGDVDPVMRAIEMEEIIGSSSETSDPPTQQTTKSIQKHPNHYHHQYHGNLRVAMPPPFFKNPLIRLFFLTGWAQASSLPRCNSAKLPLKPSARPGSCGSRWPSA